MTKGVNEIGYDETGDIISHPFIDRLIDNKDIEGLQAEINNLNTTILNENTYLSLEERTCRENGPGVEKIREAIDHDQLVIEYVRRRIKETGIDIDIYGFKKSSDY